MRTIARFSTLALLSLSTCGDGTPAIDRAKVDAAPQKYKDACEEVCTTADAVRTQSCGQVEYATHEDCYLHCVGDYLRLPQCETIFDDAFACMNQYVCDAATRCTGQVIVAMACRDGKINPAP